MGFNGVPYFFEFPCFVLECLFISGLPDFPNCKAREKFPQSIHYFVFETVDWPFNNCDIWSSPVSVISSEDCHPLLPQGISNPAFIQQVINRLSILFAHATVGWTMKNSDLWVIPS